MDEIKLLIPGAVQGFVRSLISYPFEVIKTQMQICNKSTIDTVKHIIKNDIYKFYRGISLPLVQIPAERSVQFYIYEKSKKNTSNIFMSSFFTSFITNSLFAPFSIFQVNIMNSNKDTFKGIKQFVASVNKKRAFTRGISLEISKNYFSTFIYFYIYSFSQKNLKLQNHYHNTFVSGVLSSIGVWSVVLPFDTIKVKYQTGNESIRTLLSQISKGNVLNLWKGMTPILIRTIPSSGMGMITYEYTKKLMTTSHN